MPRPAPSYPPAQPQYSGGAGLTLVDYRPHRCRPPAGRGLRPAGSLKLTFYLWGGGHPRPVVRVLSLPHAPAAVRCTATQIFSIPSNRHCPHVPHVLWLTGRVSLPFVSHRTASPTPPENRHAPSSRIAPPWTCHSPHLLARAPSGRLRNIDRPAQRAPSDLETRSKRLLSPTP